MKAIRTKYIGPSNVKGSRITATSGERSQRIIMSYPSELNSSAAHAKAARTLCDKMNWNGAMIGDGFPDGSMVWVFADSHDRA
jgi:hypothetical protein